MRPKNYRTFRDLFRGLCHSIHCHQIFGPEGQSVWVPPQPMCHRSTSDVLAVNLLIDVGALQAIDFKSAEPWQRSAFLQVRERKQGINIIYVVLQPDQLQHWAREAPQVKQRNAAAVLGSLRAAA